MKTIALGLFLVALSMATPAMAQQDVPEDRPQRPVTDDSVRALDVAKTPLTDLNIGNGDIPELLERARAAPYDTTDLKGCRQILDAVDALDAVLGEDLDTAEAKGRTVDAGRVAQWAVGSFIPFRGLIREISGAKAHERKLNDAIIAGMMRRA